MKVIPAIKSFTVDRATWLRGDGSNSMLLNRHGHMCCLGHYAVAAGVDDKEMLCEPDPISIDPLLEGLAVPVEGDADEHTTCAKRHTKLTERAMFLNDDSNIDDDVREAELIALFAEHEIELRFV